MSLQGSALRKTLRWSASIRRKTSGVRAIASPGTGAGPATWSASRASVRPYEATSPTRSAARASQTASHAARCAARIRQTKG